MADSLIGHKEAEIKCKIENPKGMVQKIMDLGAEARFIENTESDICFDFADNRLSNELFHFIIRSRQPFGELIILLKSKKKQYTQNIVIDNLDGALRLTEILGMKEIGRLTKVRSMFLYQCFHIMVDSIDGHGNYLEIGSMTDDESEIPELYLKIEEVLKKLDIKKPKIEKRSYRDFALKSN